MGCVSFELALWVRWPSQSGQPRAVPTQMKHTLMDVAQGEVITHHRGCSCQQRRSVNEHAIVDLKYGAACDGCRPAQ